MSQNRSGALGVRWIAEGVHEIVEGARSKRACSSDAARFGLEPSRLANKQLK